VSDTNGDMNRSLMLDGNGVAGMLKEIFSAEMTATPTECAACGKHSEMGELLAFTHAPGVVLRCPACEATMVRVVRTEQFTYLDARGAVYLRITR
jgi:Zn finger protein HypA/HybF involved in hydrogenase expression